VDLRGFQIREPGRDNEENEVEIYSLNHEVQIENYERRVEN
jgi:hypothetical protein